LEVVATCDVEAKENLKLLKVSDLREGPLAKCYQRTSYTCTHTMNPELLRVLFLVLDSHSINNEVYIAEGN